MRIRFIEAKMSSGWYTIKPESVPEAARAARGMKPGTVYVAEIKEYKEPRSLRANAYCWKLIGEIARVIGSTPNEVYHDMLVRYGYVRMVDSGAMTITLSAKVDLSKDTDDYLYIHTAYIGSGFVGGNEFCHYRMIRGSSEYNTAEMARFIDGVVSEAKDLDIETLTPDQLEAMKYERKAG